MSLTARMPAGCVQMTLVDEKGMQAGVHIGDVSFKSQGGLGDVAGSEWVLASVQLVKMD